jgi:hypothetical protein
MRRSPHPRIELEMAVVRACVRPSPRTLEEILEKVEDAEARLRQMSLLGGGTVKPAPLQESLLPSEPGPSPRSPSRQERPAPVIAPPSVPDSHRNVEEGWQQAVSEIMQRKPTLGHVLGQATSVRQEDERLVVALTGNHFHKELITDRANLQLINQTVQRHLPGVTRVELESGLENHATVQQHPAVQALLDTFQGEIVAVRPRASEGGEKP